MKSTQIHILRHDIGCHQHTHLPEKYKNHIYTLAESRHFTDKVFFLSLSAFSLFVRHKGNVHSHIPATKHAENREPLPKRTPRHTHLPDALTQTHAHTQSHICWIEQICGPDALLVLLLWCDSFLSIINPNGNLDWQSAPRRELHVVVVVVLLSSSMSRCTLLRLNCTRFAIQNEMCVNNICNVYKDIYTYWEAVTMCEWECVGIGLVLVWKQTSKLVFNSFRSYLDFAMIWKLTENGWHIKQKWRTAKCTHMILSPIKWNSVCNYNRFVFYKIKQTNKYRLIGYTIFHIFLKFSMHTLYFIQSVNIIFKTSFIRWKTLFKLSY